MHRTDRRKLVGTALLATAPEHVSSESNGWAQPEAEMSSSSAKDFRVAIVGGGVCGVVCAIALQRAGIQADIFEAASKYGEVGAGLGIGPNAVRVLRKLDLMTALSKEAEPPSARPFKFVFGTGEADVCFESPVYEDDLSLAMHSEFISTQHRLILHFADGTTHETDLVLGADGIKSTVRSFVVGEDSLQKNAAFTNTVVYRASSCMTMFPVRNDTLLSVASVVTDFSIPMGQNPLPPDQPWVLPATQDELLNHFKGWKDEPVAIFRSIEKPTKWFLHGMYPPLNSYVKGQVALIGDAAHAMLPFLGAGAGQGIEDAYVLARLLSHPQTNISNLEDVLKAYSLVRVPRASEIALRSKRCRDIYEGHGPSGPSLQGRLADMEVQDLASIINMGITSSRPMPPPTPFAASVRPQAVAAKRLSLKRALETLLYELEESVFLHEIRERAALDAEEIAKWALSHADLDPFHIDRDQVPNLKQIIERRRVAKTSMLTLHFQDCGKPESVSANFWALVSRRIAAGVGGMTVDQVVRIWIALEFLTQSSIQVDSNPNDNSEKKGVTGIHDEGVVQMFETLALQCLL
ncbi:hypothetical protein EVG20_g5005 [Dentipellis fragilis]|uniref:FAD-binding domain-containing protein n=1 Tax=Dentipellis fragilis TaxID=205917 RepID=A0A4Y9YUH6_9AGAM|nr:hypothetical protein EVG20_g5005 [Dentipellis fragilis]